MNIGESDEPADVKLGNDGSHILERRSHLGGASAGVLKSVAQELRAAASHLGRDTAIDPDDIKAIVDLIRRAADKLREEATLTDRSRLERQSCVAGPEQSESAQSSPSTITAMRSWIDAIGSTNYMPSPSNVLRPISRTVAASRRRLSGDRLLLIGVLVPWVVSCWALGSAAVYFFW